MKKREFNSGLAWLTLGCLLFWAVVLATCTGCNEPGHYERLTAAIHNDMGTIVDAVEESGLMRKEEAAELVDKFEKTTAVSMAAAKAYDKMAEENQVIAYLEAGKAAADEAAPFIPQAHAVSGVLSIALAVAGVIAKKNGDKAKKSGNAVREIVAGVEMFKSGAGTADKALLKSRLRTSTSPTTKAEIAEARN